MTRKTSYLHPVPPRKKAFLGLSSLALGLVALWPHAACGQAAADTPGKPAEPPKVTRKNDVSDDALFAGVVPVLQLIIPPENIDKLAKEPRVLVECTLKEKGGQTLEKCEVKLKGSAGSFRQINDDRPGFSVRTAKLKDQEFRGISKFMLNNCAQDGTMLHEQIAGEMARRAGVPASRCTHAYLTLNNKVLGTYVLKEGFNAEFLKYFFKDTHGHLYDGGFVSEINPNMEVDKGNPNEKARLLELIAACGDPKPETRLARLDKVLDIDAYLRHVFMEQVLCHWDGYSFNRNNYRIYEDPSTGKFSFILHGMDQVFGDNRWYVFRQPGAMVPNALWGDKVMRERYRTQAFAVYEKALRTVDWPRRAEQVAQELKNKLKPIDKEEAARFDQRGKDAAAQIKGRIDSVRAFLEDAAKMRSPGGKATLGAKYAWSFSNDKGDAKELGYQGKDCLYARVGTDGGADNRLQLSLPPGRYRLEGKIQYKGVKAGAGDNAKGVRLRTSGTGSDPKNAGLVGDSQGWKQVAHDFTVSNDEPTVVFEVRGAAGEAWLDRGSLTLTRLP